MYVHTPLITGSDCEGAGEMFQVTTMDLLNPPKTEDGDLDYSRDFFHKHTSLTVSGQLNAETFAQASGMFTLSDRHSARRIPTRHVMRPSSG